MANVCWRWIVVLIESSGFQIACGVAVGAAGTALAALGVASWRTHAHLRRRARREPKG